MARLGLMGIHQQQPVPADRQRSLRGTVMSVSSNDEYSFTKPVRDEITLMAGWGVAGDVHAGVTVRHRGRVAADPAQPNLRQVHLIGAELLDELREAGHQVPPGGFGENVTTSGLDLLTLPVGTVLRFTPAPDSGPASSPGVAGTADTTTTAATVVVAAGQVDLDGPSAAAVAALSACLAAETDADGRSDASPDDRPAVMITGLRNPCRQIDDYRPGLLKRVLGRNPDGSLDRRAGVMAVVLRGGCVRPGTVVEVELPALPHRPLDRV